MQLSFNDNLIINTRGFKANLLLTLNFTLTKHWMSFPFICINRVGLILEIRITIVINATLNNGQ